MVMTRLWSVAIRTSKSVTVRQSVHVADTAVAKVGALPTACATSPFRGRYLRAMPMIWICPGCPW